MAIDTVVRHSRRPTRAALAALSLPAAVISARRVIASLPTLEVCLSNSDEGRRVAALLRVRRMGIPVNRLAIAHLAVPRDLHTFLRGRSRQALRTNLHRAACLGVTCVEVVGRAEQQRRFDEVHGRRSSGWDDEDRRGVAERISSGSARFIAAFAADGTALALADVLVDNRWAMLLMFFSADDPEASDARYALHVDILKRLRGMGVEHFIVLGSSLGLSEGLLYFQYLLGFAPVNLRLAT